MCILAIKKYRNGKLECNEIDYLEELLGPGSPGLEDGSGTEETMSEIALRHICIYF